MKIIGLVLQSHEDHRRGDDRLDHAVDQYLQKKGHGQQRHAQQGQAQRFELRQQIAGTHIEQKQVKQHAVKRLGQHRSGDENRQQTGDDEQRIDLQQHQPDQAAAEDDQHKRRKFTEPAPDVFNHRHHGRSPFPVSRRTIISLSSWLKAPQNQAPSR